MEKKYDAIIIGSGIGGTAAGALLAHAGWKIIILEKNKIIGGRCTSYRHKGFTLDLGNHLFSLGDRGPIGEVCRLGGVPDAIEWVTIKNAAMRIGQTLKRYNRKTMMEVIPPSEKEKMDRLFLEAATMTDRGIDDLWYLPLDEWVGRFTDDPMAHTLIESISSQYFCIPLAETSTGEFIKCFRDTVKSQSSAYPRGGCISIPGAFVSILEKNKGEIRLHTRVRKVIIENGAAAGVLIEGGEKLLAPVIISNADIKATVKTLVGDGYFPSEYVKKIHSLTYSYQAAMLKVALKEKITEDQLLMFMPGKFSPILQITEGMSEGIVSDIVGGMLVSPTNYDPDLGPSGQQLISFGSACTLKQDWARWRRVMLNSFYAAYPEAKGKVLWHKLDTPMLIRAYAGEEGNIIGAGQTIDQIQERRPSVESPIKGLYFSSAEAGGHGIGVELAASSATELFRRLSAEA
ncbi:MAG: phytoene desaturase family protein [Syntrophales bacterium]